MNIKEAVETLQAECNKYRSCQLNCPHYIEGSCALNDPLSMDWEVRSDVREVHKHD